MANFRQLSVNFYAAMEKLRQRWVETKTKWPYEEFEKQYFAPIDKQARLTWKAMEELAQTIDQAEQHIGGRYLR